MRGKKQTELAVQRLMALDPWWAGGGAPRVGEAAGEAPSAHAVDRVREAGNPFAGLPQPEPPAPAESVPGASMAGDAPPVTSASAVAVAVPAPRRVVPAAVAGAVVVSAAIALGAGGRILLGGSPDLADLPVPDRPAAYAAVAASAARAPTRSSSAVGVDAGVAPAASASGGLAGGAPAGSGSLLVHVVGQVRHPGLVRLNVGARVADAVAAAGGATGRADLAGVNLARVLVDGEQLRVPAVGEAPQPPADAATGASGAVGAGSPVDLNHADTAALDALPGIGPVMAQRIVDYRTQHGSFRRIEELAEIPGIGERTLERLRPLVRLG